MLPRERLCASHIRRRKPPKQINCSKILLPRENEMLRRNLMSTFRAKWGVENQRYLTYWNQCFYSNTTLASLILGKVWKIPWQLVGYHELMSPRSHCELPDLQKHTYKHKQRHTHTHTPWRAEDWDAMCCTLPEWFLNVVLINEDFGPPSVG